MKVINPTDKDIAVQIRGKEYLLPANGSLSGVLKEDAEYWIGRLHSFLTVVEEDVVPTKKSEESPKEESTEPQAKKVKAVKESKKKK